jgi:GTP-binding protein Era
MSEPREHRSGFIAVVGRPNVGKSTLVNALVGHKISIVTSKPHTTRHAILGVLTRPGFQIVFIDTPGLATHATQTKNLMNRAMNQAATGSLDYADVILFVVEAGRWNPADEEALKLIRHSGLPCIVIANKIDRVKPKAKLLPYLQQLSGKYNFAAIVPVSATNSDNLDTLQNVLVDNLPEQEPLYAAEMRTDKGVRFQVAEVLREKLMQSLHQELPYGVGVEVSELEEDENGRLCADVIIWVERDSHKGIVIGHGGQGIKNVGQAARLELQETLGKPVRLESRVKVKKNWSDNAQALQQMGYDGKL